MKYLTINVFSFYGRVERTEYAVSLTICYFLIFLINFLMAFNLSFQDSLIKELLKTPYYYLILAQGSKRCQDLGKSGWYQLIPFYIYFMLFKKGTQPN